MVVTAAGNSHELCSFLSIPQAVPGVIVVASVSHENVWDDDNNNGPLVSICAHGVDVVTIGLSNWGPTDYHYSLWIVLTNSSNATIDWVYFGGRLAIAVAYAIISTNFVAAIGSTPNSFAARPLFGPHAARGRVERGYSVRPALQRRNDIALCIKKKGKRISKVK